MSDLFIVESLFDEALKLNNPADLDAFLDKKCPDSRIRRQVEKLLAAQPNLGSFLSNPPEDLTGSPTSLDCGVQIGSRIGPYKIREKIGEGGMGVVYVAEQLAPVRRKVALKVIKPGMDTKEVIARFEAERQALAVMEHPHIAGVLDVGATAQGHPYFAMELVRGIPITEYCDQARLAPRKRLRLFGDVCDAVQHAHQKGIIHRDLKPSNVLVTQISGKEVIKVIDFGLAKATDSQRLTDKTLYTGFMRLMGTPAYMSPEQAGLSGLDVDTRSDIYSLGVLLYEMLTGTTPLDKTDLDSPDYETVCRQIRDVEAPKPSVRIGSVQDVQRSVIAEHRSVSPQDLRQLLRGDLDRVVMKALQKDRELRYQTASALSEDILLYLEDKPVNAVSPSPIYLARKYARRHRVLIGAVCGFAILLIAATAISSWLAIQASLAQKQAIQAKSQAVREGKIAQQEKVKAVDAKQEAVDSERRMRRFAYAADMNLSARELSRGHIQRTRELLDRHRPENSGANQSDEEDLRGWEWRYLWQFCQDDPHETLFEDETVSLDKLSVSHDQRYLAITVSSSAGSHVYVRNLERSQEVTDFPGSHATFSPTEPILAYWGKDSTNSDDRNGSFRLWDARTRNITNDRLFSTENGVLDIAFSSDGETLAVSTTSSNRIHPSEFILLTVADGSILKTHDAINTDVYPFAFTSDLSLLAHGAGQSAGDNTDRKNVVRVIDLNTGNQLWQSTPTPIGEWIECLALSPDRQLLAVAHGKANATLQVWDVEKGTQVCSLTGHHAYVRDLVFAENRQLISASGDQTVRVWNLTDLGHVTQDRVFRAHENEVSRVVALPDGNIISGCRAGRVIKWDTSSVQERRTDRFRFDSQRWWTWRIKPDQTALISVARETGVVSEWTGDQYETERKLFRLGDDFHAGSVSLDATKVAAGYKNGIVELWDIERQESILKLVTGDGAMLPDQFYADDDIVEVMHGGWWGAKFLWDLRTNTKKYTWPHTNILISLDGSVGLTLPLQGPQHKIVMIDFGGGPDEILPESWKMEFPYGQVAISPDGQSLAAVQPDNSRRVVVRDLHSKRQIGSFGGFMVGPSSVYFSPDNRRLITSGISPWGIIMYDVASQQQVLTLESDGDTRRWVRFSPEGNIITAQDEAGIVYGWRAPSWEEIAAAEANPSGIPAN